MLREYKALQAIEHSSYIKTILDPARALDERPENAEYAPDYDSWIHFLKKNGEWFNDSQLGALRKVAEMRKQDALLIQGPVSYSLLIYYSQGQVKHKQCMD